MSILNNFQLQLKEGLIVTHNIINYKTSLISLLDQYNIEYDINIKDKLEFFITIYNPNKYTCGTIVSICNNLGYFPSYIYVTLKNNMINNFKFDKFKYSDNIKEFKIKFEAKYDDKLYKNDIICPDILYHLTYQKYKQSILQKGLYPKSKNRLSVHPERIYLFKNLNDFNNLVDKLKMSDVINNISEYYMLLEIDSSDDKFILHTDPNYRLGYFTYDNININNIKFLKENI